MERERIGYIERAGEKDGGGWEISRQANRDVVFGGDADEMSRSWSKANVFSILYELMMFS